MKEKILIIEDEFGLLITLSDRLVSEGYLRVSSRNRTGWRVRLP
ncbi:MAG: hypothetical protein AB1798_00400 [Spirochaetota bacterium]